MIRRTLHRCFASVASYQLNLAWASSAAMKELSFAGRSAAIASQLLATPGVRLVNSIVYGVDVGQSGADWHVDQPSFHMIEDDSPTLSTWLALGTIEEAVAGGSLKFVSAARAAAAGCVADAATGRPSGDARRDCVAAPRRRRGALTSFARRCAHLPARHLASDVAARPGCTAEMELHGALGGSQCDALSYRQLAARLWVTAALHAWAAARRPP